MITEHTMSNGIRLVIEQEPQFRSVSLGIWVKVGSAYETKENQGISHLIEHMLFKGTRKHSAKEISGLIARIGDDVNAYTSNEYTCYYGSTLPEFLPALADLFSDMLTNSLFLEDELTKEELTEEELILRKEKSVVMDEIDMYNDSPEDLVHEKLQEAVWCDHPLSFLISGDKTSVEQITRADLVAFFKKHYTGRNMILSVAGNPGMSSKELILRLERLFIGIPCGETSSLQSPLTAPQFTPTSLYIQKKIEQLHINLAFDAVSSLSEERYVAGVFNAVFGGSDNSLLFQTIREEQGLAYSVYSYQNNYRTAGLFHIDITVNPSQATTVVEEVARLISKCKEEELTQEQLEVYKNQIRIDLILHSESAKSRMSRNAKDYLYFERLIPLEETIAGIMAVSPRKVTEFAKKYLILEQAGLCLVGRLTKREQNKIDALFA